MKAIERLASVTVVLSTIGCGGGDIADAPIASDEDTGTIAVEETSAPITDSGVVADTQVPPPVETGPATVGVFVAQGHMGRTTISCDDGRTWIKNKSDDDSIRCFEGVDCDHTEGAGRGIDIGDNTIVATFGWGKPGAVRRSRDGESWEKTLVGTTFGGIVFDPVRDAFVATSRTPQVSGDVAKTWTKTAEPSVSVWNVRGAGFAAGNVVMVFEDSGKVEAVLSNDAGKSWWKPTTLPSTCGKSIQGIVFGKDTVLIVGGDGTACRSTDGGKTFTDSKMGGTVSSSALFTGTEFVAWGRTDRNVMYKSADGATWSTTPTTPSIGPAARSDDGTFVATNSGWMVWYEKQAFYRSKDGVTWETLPKTSFVGSHPIRGIAYGRLDASACK
jgi:hypothetical protein